VSGGVAAVEATGLVKRYREVTAVDRVSLRVQPGEVYALLGLNGAGKTTTIRMLLGMVTPSAGAVTVFGEAVRPSQTAVWSRVGYLVERAAAYPELTVRENLELVRRLRRLPDRNVVPEVIERLGLSEYANRRARGLSLGNAQRLALAKALIAAPDLLVLDEPANALDPAGVVEIRQLLRELAEQRGVAVLLSSHVLAEVTRLATRIGILHEGRMVRELTADDLAAGLRPRLHVSARDRDAAAGVLREAGMDPQPDGGHGLLLHEPSAVQTPDAVAILLVNAGHPPTRLAVEHEDLEAYFLRLVGADPDD
jgi:ABC-2 type transport system ATP-binding protein